MRETETTRPRMRAETNLITGTVSFSVDGENYPNKTFPDSKSVRKALFFNDRINLSDNQILSLGVRYDNYELNTIYRFLLSQWEFSGISN